MALTKIPFSGSTNGRGIKVAATATAGTLIHTAQAGTGSLWDEIWAWAFNFDTASRTVTFEFGGVTSPDDLFSYEIPSKSGLILVVPGEILQNSLVLRAFASVTNMIMVTGYVNRNS